VLSKAVYAKIYYCDLNEKKMGRKKKIDNELLVLLLTKRKKGKKSPDVSMGGAGEQ
jgi:hypothetical protein